jgi:hypothetical protein
MEAAAIAEADAEINAAKRNALEHKERQQAWADARKAEEIEAHAVAEVAAESAAAAAA